MKKILLFVVLIMLAGCIHRPATTITTTVSTGAVHVDVPINNTGVDASSATINANDNKVGVNDNKAGVNDNVVKDNKVYIEHIVYVPSATVVGVIGTLKPWQFIFIVLVLAVVGIICFMIYVNKKK